MLQDSNIPFIYKQTKVPAKYVPRVVKWAQIIVHIENSSETR